MGRIIAVANQKGGCGKTTTAVNLAASLAVSNRKVLLVDLDSQGHSTLGFGVKPDLLDKTVYELLTSDTDAQLTFQDIKIKLTESLDLLPANLSLIAMEQELAGMSGREDKLLRALQEYQRDYDYILIDCPPNLGILTFNALRVSQEVMIPTDCTQFCRQGVDRLTELVALLREQYHQELIMYGLITNFDGRSAFSRMIQDEQKQNFPGIVLKTIINISSKVREATYCGQPVIEYARHSEAARKYQELADEVIEQEPGTALLSLAQAVPQKAIEPLAEDEEILFRVKAPHARKVSIVGTFNYWKPQKHPMNGPDDEGYWYASMVLPGGTHHYKYVIDSDWILDPENPIQDDDGFGGRNSVVEL